jgi:putative NADPH-quinone reductase
VKAYVVYCHPDADSFTAAVCERVVTALRDSGNEVRMTDLYADGFEPALSLQEHIDYLAPSHRAAEISPYIDNLRWCDALVFVYPTWWSGQPAMLTGWLDRVLLRGVAWDMTDGGTTITAKLTNVRRLVTITSHGSSKFLNVVEGESGRRVIGRAVRALCHRFARTTWLAMYNIDRSTNADRLAFLDRVDRRIRRLSSSTTSIASGRKR